MNYLGFILLVMWVAVANVAIGFALAVAVGHGPARMPRWRWPSLAALAPRIRWRSPRGDEAEADIATATESEDATPVEEEAQRIPPVNNEPPPSGDLVTEPEEVVSLDVALAQLQEEVEEVRSEFAAVDVRVQSCANSPTVEGLEDCITDLHDAGARYLERQKSAIRVMDDTNEGGPGHAAAKQTARMAAAKQADELQHALEEIGQWEVDPENLAQECQRLLGETEKLMESCDAVSETVKDAAKSAEVEEVENEPPEHVDASTALGEWWSDDPDHTRPLTMTLIEVDNVKEHAERHGPEAVDELLAQIQQEVLAAKPSGGAAFQVNAQRYLMLFSSSDTGECGTHVEQVRSATAQCQAVADGETIQATISCALVTSQTGEAPESLLERTRLTLQVAHANGGNCTYFHDGQQPAALGEPALA